MTAPATEPKKTPAASEQRPAWFIALALFAVVVCAYSTVFRADFIDFDDNSHVFENPLVTAGLSWRSVGEAFAISHASLWIPLTWISFMADVSLFGLNPGLMHAENLLLHAASTVLLFFTLRRMTRTLWSSAFIAALFGLHPLNVESVAWVAERKSLLCVFFWLLASRAYIAFSERQRAGVYAAMLLASALALLSKPMAVTLPFTLLLLDLWPLERWRSVRWTRLVAEKLPLFLFTASACWMAMHAPRASSVVTVETLSLSSRVSNALVSYASYLGMIFWPTDLGVFYPHPIQPQPLLALAATALLLGITTIALLCAQRRAYLLVGWLWFLGVLVPVLGLVQVGSQARADRFTYVPQIGIFVALTWLVKNCRPRRAFVLPLGAFAVLSACALLTAKQASYWQNGTTLFEHTIAVTKNNACACANAGLNRAREGDFVKAEQHFQESLRILPQQAPTWREYGRVLVALHRPAEGIAAFRTALGLNPSDVSATYQLAVTLQQIGAAEEAITHFQALLRDTPNSAGCHYFLGLALRTRGRIEEARTHLQEAARLAPQNAEIVSAAKSFDVAPHGA